MNTLILVVLDKKIFQLHFENLLFDPGPTYATNWNDLNNFGRGTPRDHSCEVWSRMVSENKSFE